MLLARFRSERWCSRRDRSALCSMVWVQWKWLLGLGRFQLIRSISWCSTHMPCVQRNSIDKLSSKIETQGHEFELWQLSELSVLLATEWMNQICFPSWWRIPWRISAPARLWGSIPCWCMRPGLSANSLEVHVSFILFAIQVKPMPPHPDLHSPKDERTYLDFRRWMRRCGFGRTSWSISLMLTVAREMKLLEAQHLCFLDVLSFFAARWSCFTSWHASARWPCGWCSHQGKLW